MPGANVKPIPVADLYIDLENPRYDQRASQRVALTSIVNDQGDKVVNLAEDVCEKGLNPTELLMVTESGDGKTYIVLEGNRRVAALKLLAEPSLLASLDITPRIFKRLKGIHDQFGSAVPKEVLCVILSREDANYWIQLKHTGENAGRGVVPWDGVASQRFRGNSPALQAVDLVSQSPYIDDETRAKLPKIAITNIERILGTPDARELLGVDVKGRLLVLKHPEEESLARLAIVVSDVANQKVKVTQLDSRDQRVAYAQQVASAPMPDQHPAPEAGSTAKKTKAATHAAKRTTLVPKNLKVAISQTRISKIFWELQKLNVNTFINASAVMFRVFIELSCDDFAARHSISLTTSKGVKPGAKPRDMNLREKLRAVADYLEIQNVCTKHELRGVRSLVANREHVLSVDSLNAYVHNKDYNPAPSDLRANWDSVQVFVEKLWSA